MVRKIRVIKAPSKIYWGLRFKNRCVKCGKVIPQNMIICTNCRRKTKKNFY